MSHRVITRMSTGIKLKSLFHFTKCKLAYIFSISSVLRFGSFFYFQICFLPLVSSCLNCLHLPTCPLLKHVGGLLRFHEAVLSNRHRVEDTVSCVESATATNGCCSVRRTATPCSFTSCAFLQQCQCEGGEGWNRPCRSCWRVFRRSCQLTFLVSRILWVSI